MLRKAISISLLFLVLFLGYQFLINSVKNEHFINYKINDFDIDENYIKNDEEYYLFKIKTKDNKEFVFEVENEFNKQKQIVQDVIDYSNDDLYCISLKLKNKKENTEPLCMKNNIVYSYREISKTEDLKNFTSKLKLKDNNIYKEESEKRVEKDLTLNQDYLDEDEVIIMYDYKQVGFHYKRFSRFATFSNNDNYKNEYGVLVGKYYLVPRLGNSPTYNTYIRYDIDNGIKTDMNMVYNISKQSYINGVYDGKLYIFDKSEMKQYEIDPAEEEVEIIGDVNDDGFGYINGKLTDISVYDLNKEEVKFTEKIDGYKDINYDAIYANKKYAIYSIGDEYYKVYEKYPNNPILLFSAKNIKEMKVKGDNIYYIIDNSIYRYNKYGNVVLATRNELIYNSENIFDIYFK